tara:strand:+ start:121 stop:1077 length:957 start_codon:yes stop_codon:yes gene_type:complete
MYGILNRRYLRVKVFQAIYAYSQSNNDLIVGEKNMLKSINEIYDLFLYEVQLILDVVEMARRNIEQNREKRLPTPEDLNPNMKFVENQVISMLENNEVFTREVEKRKISWGIESDNVKKLWRAIRECDEYLNYMNNPERSFKEDKELIVKLYKNYIVGFEALHHFLEDRSIYWMDDLTVVSINVAKTINHMKYSEDTTRNLLPSLFKDREDDVQFVKELYRKTILNDEELSQHIEEKTKNWEVDRIVRLDVILMKMALAEFLYFKTIPVKVSMNEYIELAKSYSTPNSKNFINGILDKLVADLKSKGIIQKVGRGLIE